MLRTALTLAATFAVAFTFAGAPQLRAQSAAPLSGQVTSAEEGAMEGVIVSAHKDGGNITVSVVSDDKGHFSFPANRVGPGSYAISARAAGYDLDTPKTAAVADGQPATLDVQLKKTKNLAHQLTNAEWMMSVPGTDNDKLQLINCVSCHTVERIMRSTHTADEFVALIARMNSYAQVSQPVKPQRRIDLSRAADPERFRKVAEWLSTINLSKSDTWTYDLKTLPRVKGAGTKVVVTEYDLPRPTIEPHDVVALNGTVYYSNFGEQFLGRLDPKTGATKDYAMTEFKKGSPKGNLDVGIDKQGNLWLGMMYQAAIAKFDPKSEQFTYFRPDPSRDRDNLQLNMVTTNYDVDGKVWINDAGTQDIFRLDINTGKFEEFDPLKSLPTGKAGHSIYDVRADSRNNVYLTEYQRNNLLRIDAKTGQFTSYQVPTDFSRNRRGRMDDQDRFWFAQFRGNKITMFDTKAETFKEFPLPTKFTQPYDVVVDKDGDAWTGGMFTDRVVRVDTKTGDAVEYPLPRDTNMRRMFVDNSTTPPTFWVGSNHGASIVRVEPQD